MNVLSVQKSAAHSKAALWTGRIIGVIVTLFLLMDAVLKLFREQHHVKGTVDAGFSAAVVQPLGLTLLLITILYIIPRTALIGVVLLTAYLGGAVAVMIQQSMNILFPVIFCTLAWVALYFRNEKLRSILSGTMN